MAAFVSEVQMAVKSVGERAVFEGLLGDEPPPRPRRGQGSNSDEYLLYAPVQGCDHWTALFRHDRLGLLDTTNARAPVLLGSLQLPTTVKQSYGGPKVQRIGDLLCIGDGRGYLLVNVSDPTAPTLDYALRGDSQRTHCWFTAESVLFFYYLNRGNDPTDYRMRNGSSEKEAASYPSGDGMFRQPLRGGIDTIEAVPSKKEPSKIHGSWDGPGGAVLLSQDGIDVYNAAKNLADTGKRWSLFRPALVGLGEGQVVAMERMESKMAGRVFDVTGKKPKVVADLFKKHWVQTYGVDAEGTLWMVLAKEVRNVTVFSLGAVGLDGAEQGPWELSREEWWWGAKRLAVGGGCARVWFEEGQSLVIELD